MASGPETAESGGQISSLSTVDEDSTVIIWAKERNNYVTPSRIVAFQIKSPAKFGWKTTPYFGKEDGNDGVLCSISWSALLQIHGTMLEIVDSGCPLAEFLGKLNNPKVFDHLRWLRIRESDANIDQVCFIVQHAEQLAMIEIYEPQFAADDRRKLLKALASRKELKAFDFIHDFSGKELNDWFVSLKLKLRHVRFSGPPAVKLSDLKMVNVEMPVVEFLAVQDLDVDIPIENGANPNWHRDLFNRFCHMFPGMKYFFFDFKVFDTVFIYDDTTARIFESFRDFYRRMKLVCFAILIYCPDDEMKASVAKAAKFLVDDCEIRTEVKEFFCGSSDVENTAPNFALLVLGDQVHSRTVRLVETVVAGRNTCVDLRHFCYVMDLDAVLRPDSTVAFGGFDREVVRKMYEEKHDRFSTPDFVPDSVMQRYVQG